MPEIKYKKKTYAGASFPCLEMTKAQYDALPEAKKMDGTVYLITDDDGGWEAERSTYDNTESGLTATNVQEALDEIVESLTTLIELDPSKTVTDYPIGIFPVIWEQNVTIGGNTATANYRGFAFCNGVLLHAFVTGVVAGDAYIVGNPGTGWASRSLL